MGWAFVRRRMRAELGPDWEKRFKSFEHEPAAAASLGQVHRAVAHDGRAVACKLQYPEHGIGGRGRPQPAQPSILAVQRRFSPEIDTREILKELGERLREELDYEREARHMRLYGEILADAPEVHVPAGVAGALDAPASHHDLARGKAAPLLRRSSARGAQPHRDGALQGLVAALRRITASSTATRISAITRSSRRTARPAGLNLLDYGCIRIFPPSFVEGVIELYRGFQTDDRDRIAAAYRDLGLSRSDRRA